MEADEKHVIALTIGGLIGALLGAGIAYTLVKSPANLEPGELPGPLKTKDLLSLTNTATSLIKQLDNVRRKT